MVQSKILLQFNNISHYFFNRFEYEENKLKHDFPNSVFIDQIHSNKIKVINKRRRSYYKGYDGIVTQRKIFLVIKTADCLPVFFFEKKRNIIGAVHAGWRGLKQEILPAMVDEICKLGGESKNIIVAVGPHIKDCCFSVSKDFLEKFEIEVINNTVIYHHGKEFVDLSKIACIQLQSKGIMEKQIEISDHCTSCNTDYYSYRRAKDTRRMYSILGIN